MKFLCFGIAASFFISASAFAADSTCLLGDDGKIAVTTFEHRAANDERATSVTLIYGSHLLRGILRNADSGQIYLAESSAKQMKSTDNGYRDNYVFRGFISVDYSSTKITLKGKIHFSADADDTPEEVNTKLECKELDPGN